ncbi:hypothetical protein DSECCO2_653530 [anaerobic digester metagenome]
MDPNNDKYINKYEEALWESKNRFYAKRKFEVILKIYMIVGVLTSVFGITYFVLSTLNIELSNSQINALIISGVGFTVAIMSWGMVHIMRERLYYERQSKNSMLKIAEFLRYWAKFENAGKDVLEKEHREFNKYSIREIIDLLYKEGKIDENEVITLEEAIQLRNSIVHNGEDMPYEKANKYIDVLSQVIQKIVKI